MSGIAKTLLFVDVRATASVTVKSRERANRIRGGIERATVIDAVAAEVG